MKPAAGWVIRKSSVSFPLWAGLLCSLAHAAAPAQVEVFRAGQGGYSSYRIPALVRSAKGTLLAFCEGRRNSAADSGDIDVLLRRSFDGGKTWQPVQTVADKGTDTIGNPAPVVDRKTGAILLLLTSNPGTATERQITGATAPARTVWIARSTDDGGTWSAPVEITSQVKRPEWTWYATGPGNGIQLRSGRLVVPCDHNRRDDNSRHSHLIYSDDHGATWHIGAVAEEKTNESAVAERHDGSLLLDMRSYHGKNRRAEQVSRDGGITLEPLTLVDALIEPVCQASLISAGGRQLLFSNPASTKRENMTVRWSGDDGNTWSSSRVIHSGPSAYSSLAMLNGRSVGLLYERGEKTPYEQISFTRLDVKRRSETRP
jgi:sialidase-1